MDVELILKNVGRHIHLDKEEEAYFTSLLTQKKLAKKELLLRAGDISYQENFITKGCLRMYSIDSKGVEHIVMFAVEDWWIGDLYSFLTHTPASFYIDALEETELLQISKDNLQKLYQNVPKFERFYRIMFQNAFVAQQQRINQNLSFTAEQRFNYFIQKYPQLEQRIPQKQVAAYLGITPEFLSMLRKKRAKK